MKKRPKILVTTFFLVVLLGTLSISVLRATPESPDILILYDSGDRTTGKAIHIIKELLKENNQVRYVPIQDLNQYELFLLTATSERIFHVFHGTMGGMLVGNELISWNEVSTLVDQSNVAIHQFQSCYSEFVYSDNKIVSGNSGRVDALIVGLSTASDIAEATGKFTRLSEIRNVAYLMQHELIKRAIYPIDPLWTGPTHNNLSRLAIDLLDYQDVRFSREYDYGKDRLYDWFYTSDLHINKMKAAASADQEDGIDELQDEHPLEMYIILHTNSEVRTKWLKHVGGTITESRCGEVVAYWQGTVAQAAEDAFNSAVAYWKEGEYSDGAVYLSYAAHYLQDASQPYHTHDYTANYNDIFTLLLNILWVNQYINDHNALEAYVEANFNDEWWQYKDEYGTLWKPNIHHITDVSESVDYLVDLSRWVNIDKMKWLDSANSDLYNYLNILMTETVRRGAGLYELFAKKVALDLVLASVTDGQVFEIPETTSITLEGITCLKASQVFIYVDGNYVGSTPTIIATGGRNRYYSFTLPSSLLSVSVTTSYTITLRDSLFNEIILTITIQPPPPPPPGGGGRLP